MTMGDLMAAVEKAEAARASAGLPVEGAGVILSVPFKREPKNWDRVRVVPGLYGRCIGWSGEGRIYVVDIKATDARAYAERALRRGAL